MVRVGSGFSQYGRPKSKRPRRTRRRRGRKSKSRSQYVRRELSLKTLGFASYADYLASPLWAEIKAKLLAEHAVCRLCNELPAYTGHHVCYTVPVLAGKDLGQIVAICKRCHQTVEFRDSEKLTDTSEIYRRLSKTAIYKRGGAQSKKVRKQAKPKCRCCNKQNNPGRDQICLCCYKRYGPRVHEIAAENDRKAAASVLAATT